MTTYVHGDNIAQKKAHPTKYRQAEAVRLLAEIEARYNKWKKANLELKGNGRGVIDARTKLLNEYKNFVDQQKYAEMFDSRSNLHSSVLEEFLVYLFEGSVPHMNMGPVIGKGETFKSFYLAPRNFADLLDRPQILVETKDHDFMIGTTIKAEFQNNKNQPITSAAFQIPAVAVECKTYLDKTNVGGCINLCRGTKTN